MKGVTLLPKHDNADPSLVPCLLPFFSCHGCCPHSLAPSPWSLHTLSPSPGSLPLTTIMTTGGNALAVWQRPYLRISPLRDATSSCTPRLPLDRAAGVTSRGLHTHRRRPSLSTLPRAGRWRPSTGENADPRELLCYCGAFIHIHGHCDTSTMMALYMGIVEMLPKNDHYGFFLCIFASTYSDCVLRSLLRCRVCFEYLYLLGSFITCFLIYEDRNLKRN